MLDRVIEDAARVRSDARERADLVRLARLFRDSLAAGAKGAPDRNRIEDAVASAWEPGRANLLYFVAKFLKLRGRTDDAEGYYARCVQCTSGSPVNRALAAVELRKRGKNPMAVKWATDPTSGVPAAAHH